MNRDENWTVRRWITLAAIVLLAQTGALFLLGKNQPAIKTTHRPAPVLLAASGSQEMIALDNPTLFALPNPRAFSGDAWLKMPATSYRSAEWSEPQRWLDLRAKELGNTFHRLLGSDGTPKQIAQKIEPEYALPRLPASGEELSPRSTFRVEDELANRAPLSHFDLRSWTNSALLTNSVVQLWVDAAGFTPSATLLVSSGSKDADDAALALTKAVRFEPLSFSQRKKNPGKLTLGRIIFEWQTALLITTNKF